MGVRLFGQDVSGQVRRAVARGLPRAQLLKQVAGQRDSADSTAGLAISYKTYPCRALEDNSEETRRQGSETQQSGRLVLIVGDTLPRGITPAPGDRIKILGEQLEIVGDGVSTDPARAVYLCACRG